MTGHETPGFWNGQMLRSDRDANEAARFSPAGAGDGYFNPACVEIGGVQAYVYVRDGILVISLHYEGADTGMCYPDPALNTAGPFAVYGQDEIPTVIFAGGGKPVWTALPDDAVTEDDARAIRKANDDSPDTWPQNVIPDWALGD